MKKIRIVRDHYLGYEIQVRHWWFPFWYQWNFVNTFSSLERAQEAIKEDSRTLWKGNYEDL